MRSDDSILAECQRQPPTVTAKLDNPMTTASFITVTVTRTETNCKPEFPCEVREEQTETAGLIGPSGRPLPPARASPGLNAGAAAPKGASSPLRPHYKEVPGIHNQADKPQGIAGALTVHSEKSATPSFTTVEAPTFESVRPEKPATSLIVPSRRPQAVGAGDSGPHSPQPMVTNAPTALGTIVVGGLPLVVSAVPAPPATFGPHIEQPALVAVGPKTMTMGVAATYADTIIAIKTASGGATVAVVGNSKSGKWQTIPLNGEGGASVAGFGFGGGGDTGLGGIFAPTPVALPQQQAPRPNPIVGGTTLTPAANGGYSVAGSSLVQGGPPITLLGSANAGESAGSGSPGSNPSATVLSLTTNAAGEDVLLVDGKPSVLPAGPFETGSLKPAQYTGSGSDLTSMPASASATHKNAAPDRPSWAMKRWRFDVAIYIMALISW
jgi:hypothetical protein